MGRRVEAFVLAIGWKGPLPKAMLDTFFFLDNFFGKMEAQKAKKEAEAEKRKQQRP